MLLLVKLQALVCNFTKGVTPLCVISTFLKLWNGNKICKASQIHEQNVQSVSDTWTTAPEMDKWNILNIQIASYIKPSEMKVV